MQGAHHDLERGATLVTANARLARDLRRDYDALERAADREAWAAPDILAWDAWIERCWTVAVREGAAPPKILLGEAQERFLWERVIGASPEGAGLLHLPATAAAAREAFSLAANWELRLREEDCLGFEDAAAFARWAARFRAILAEREWISRAVLEEELARRQPVFDGGASPGVLLHAGFDEFTPAQQRLLDALAEAGWRVRRVSLPALPGTAASRRGLADRAAEIEAAAEWARRRLGESPAARIAIVVPDLESTRAAVERGFEDILHPSWEAAPHKGRRAFHISAGLPPADVPVIAAALQCLELGTQKLSIADSGLLLRSPFFAAAEEERGRRALLDAELRRRGFTEVTPGLLAALAAGRGREGHVRPWRCPVLARSMRAWRRTGEMLRARRMPAEWSRIFSRLLRLSSWPGPRALNSAEYQAVERWHELLSELASLDLVAEPVSYAEALARLRGLAARGRFGVADEGAPVQILGMLEAAGSAFDALWVAGMEDRRWPAAPEPNPFLPPPAQRRLGLPHSSAERELAYARRTTERLLASAPEVVASYPRREGDTDLRPSPLIAGLPEAAAPAGGPSVAALLRTGAVLEWFEDRSGPPMEPGALVRGGMSILQRQAACPFSAFAQCRLHARGLEEPAPGFSPQERGSAAHAALDLAWRELQTRDALAACAPAARREIVGRAAAAAVETQARGRGPAERLKGLERQRLERLLEEWLTVEAGRGPFSVTRTEEARRVEVGGLAAEVRVDRVDRLPDGREVIIDYKTSACSPGEWEGDRPDAPQLPLYAATHPAPLAAVLFAQLVLGDLRFKGLGENAGVPHIRGAADDTLAGRVAEWRRALEALGAEFVRGEAAVDPKNAEACRYCDLPALCRVADGADAPATHGSGAGSGASSE